jgi:hypothetical protein
MKYVRDARIWRDFRLLQWPIINALRGRGMSPRRAGTSRRARRRKTRSPPSMSITAAIVLTAGAAALHAQSPAQAPAPYRAPTIALVQPPMGGTVPRDKPVVVLRFARGEATDPVDVSTFALSVDGVNRTPLFQVTADEAWGPLTKPASTDSLITIGAHAVVARVCSVRGACAETATTVLVVDAPNATATSAASQSQSKSTRTRVIELVLDAMRKLIVP